jgi:hypothetical protein
MWARARVARAASMTCVPAVGVGRAVDGPGVLGVDDQQPVEAGQRRQVGVQARRVQRRELLNAGVEQEALEPEHAGVVQAAQLPQVARDRPTPEAHVDEALALGALALDLEGGHVHGRRDRVQRHVDDGGHAAGGGGPGGGREPLPLGAAGLVDVHVGVDQARQQDHVVPEVDHPPPLEPGVQRLDGGDPPIGDPDTAASLPCLGDQAAGAEDRVVLGHRASLACRYARQPP